MYFFKTLLTKERLPLHAKYSKNGLNNTRSPLLFFTVPANSAPLKRYEFLK